MKTVLVLLAVFSLSACGAKDATIELVDSMGGGSFQQPSSGVANCENMSGEYTIGSFGKLSIQQTGCEKVRMIESCSGMMCDFASIENFSLELPLDGTPTKIGEHTYRVRIENSKMILVKSGSGQQVVTRTFAKSAHPCDPANGQAGLEVELEEANGDVSTTTCQPWQN